MTAADLVAALLALAQFEEIWIVDFEFISKPGEHPDVVCLVAHELRSGRTLRRWCDQLGPQPPYRTDVKVLFVCFVANAECTCHLALGWPLPASILDLSPVFRCVVNGRVVPQGKGLLGALAYYGLPAASAKYKDAMRARILQGPPYTPEEREEILTYCEGDTTETADLLPKLLQESDFNLGVALHWGEFVAASAVMEHRGIQLDREIAPQLQDKRAWAFVRDAVVPRIDAQYGVYTQDKVGDWHFNIEKFEALCARRGIDWPRLPSGKLNLQRKTFESMCKAYPELEALRQLRHTRDKMRRIKLAIGADGKNRTTLWAFSSKTSRTQPSASEWVFSPAVWLRSLIKPDPGRAVAYVDWASMEFQVAAVLSECEPMLELYATGSPYVEFAKRFGAAPPSATKKTHTEVHETYKTVLLGAQYVMQYETLAQRLGISSFAAHEMLNQHRGLFNRYWAWSDDWVARSIDTGVMRTPMGWACRTGITEFNARSIANWPIQATSADIMRLAVIMTVRAGIGLCGCVHDALVIESSIDRIDADVVATKEIMRRASRIVLNSSLDGKYELRTDATVVRHPDRFSDKRGVAMWTEILGLLDEYRRQQRRNLEEAG